jgi:hypothetical protein
MIKYREIIEWRKNPTYTHVFLQIQKFPVTVNMQNILYLILPAALGPGVYSVSKRNEYRKHKNNNVSEE